MIHPPVKQKRRLAKRLMEISEPTKRFIHVWTLRTIAMATSIIMAKVFLQRFYLKFIPDRTEALAAACAVAITTALVMGAAINCSWSIHRWKCVMLWLCAAGLFFFDRGIEIFTMQNERTSTLISAKQSREEQAKKSPILKSRLANITADQVKLRDLALEDSLLAAAGSRLRMRTERKRIEQNIAINDSLYRTELATAMASIAEDHQEIKEAGAASGLGFIAWRLPALGIGIATLGLLVAAKLREDELKKLIVAPSKNGDAADKQIDSAAASPTLLPERCGESPEEYRARLIGMFARGELKITIEMLSAELQSAGVSASRATIYRLIKAVNSEE